MAKSVIPFLLKISPLMFPTDNCARTMDINTIAKVSLSLKLELSTHWCLELYFSFLWSFYCIPVGIRYYSEWNYTIKPLNFCSSYCAGTQYMSSVFLLLKKVILNLGCILKLPGELLKTIQMPRPHSKPIILDSQGRRLSICIFKCSYRRFQSYSQGWDHWFGVNHTSPRLAGPLSWLPPLPPCHCQ